MPGVLEGVRVLDFGRYIAGPWCAALLGDFGAEVIRVEKVGGGEDRFINRVSQAEDSSGVTYLQVNRNKKGLTLDPTTDERARDPAPARGDGGHRGRQHAASGPSEQLGLDYATLARDPSRHHPRVEHLLRNRGALRAQARVRRPRPGDVRQHAPLGPSGRAHPLLCPVGRLQHRRALRLRSGRRPPRPPPDRARPGGPGRPPRHRPHRREPVPHRAGGARPEPGGDRQSGAAQRPVRRVRHPRRPHHDSRHRRADVPPLGEGSSGSRTGSRTNASGRTTIAGRARRALQRANVRRGARSGPPKRLSRSSRRRGFRPGRSTPRSRPWTIPTSGGADSFTRRITPAPPAPFLSSRRRCGSPGPRGRSARAPRSSASTRPRSWRGSATAPTTWSACGKRGRSSPHIFPRTGTDPLRFLPHLPQSRPGSRGPRTARGRT